MVNLETFQCVNHKILNDRVVYNCKNPAEKFYHSGEHIYTLCAECFKNSKRWREMTHDERWYYHEDLLYGYVEIARDEFIVLVTMNS